MSKCGDWILKYSSLLLICFLLFCLCSCDVSEGESSSPSAVSSETTAISNNYVLGDFVYAINSDGNAELTLYRGTDELIEIPTEIGGYLVNRIGEGCFKDCSSLKELRLINEIRYVGEEAFKNCVNLETVTVGDKVTFLGRNAFENCVSLKDITLGSKLSSVRDGCFKNCTSLEKIVFPSSLSTFGNEIFAGAYSLTSIEVDEKNTQFKSQNGILYNKEMTVLLVYPCGLTEGEYSVPLGVEEIGNGAFAHNLNLTSVNIPSSVRTIGNSAFEGCDNIQTIILPPSISYIGNSAFEGLVSLSELTLPPDILTVGDFAFKDCILLKELIFDESLTLIGEGAFENCSALTDINLPEGLTKIGSDAFENCISLTQIALPSSVTEIGSGLFKGCVKLGTITVNEENKSFISADNIIYNAEISVVIASAPAIKQSVILPESVVELGEFAFVDSFAPEVILNDGLVTIKSGAFQNASVIKNITIPQSTITIEDFAFGGLPSLTEISIPLNVSEIGEDSFANYNENLTLITSSGSYAAVFAVEHGLGLIVTPSSLNTSQVD